MLNEQFSSLNSYQSQIENTLLKSTKPPDIQVDEEITINDQTGLWANKNECLNWKGEIPLNEYKINEDHNPEIIVKKNDHSLEYTQEIAIQYLRPPTPPPPGEILIRLESNIPTPPAPPLIIRQQPPRPATPPPLVIREAPPKPPTPIGKKVITISGKQMPPPPRKVIIERLPPLPSKPQSIIIERWLPYVEQKRQVIFSKPSEPDPIIAKPKNLIIQWEAPQVDLRKIYVDLGCIEANPQEYIQRYGMELKDSSQLPSFVTEIRPPPGLILAAEYEPNYELEGDIDALKLIDLDKEGLSEYKKYLSN
jgi:hypothetical protein